MAATTDVAGALARVVGALPGGESRPGQLDMARAVAESIDRGRHLLVQAGTGTGKSLGYLVPAILSRRRVVVATATKALQEQLVDKDIPLLQRSLGRPFRAALLKGRSNYLCLAALDGATGDAAQGELVEDDRRRSALGREELAELSVWAQTTATGDRSDLPGAMADGAWASVSVGVGECPGAHRCPSGERCFAERAKAAAAEADVVVVNTHLYGADLRSGGFVLPDHEVVVIDEAHAFEDVAADSLGAAVGPVRLEHLARACRGLFTVDHPAASALTGAGARLSAVLEGLAGKRVAPHEGDLAVALLGCAEAVAGASGAARGVDALGDGAGRRERLLQLASTLGEDLRALGEADDGRVAWVEGGPFPLLRTAPVDVGEKLADLLFATTTVILTSATLAVAGSFEPLAGRLGLPVGAEDEAGREWTGLDVGSPFDHGANALLYCAAHLPDPRAPDHPAAMLEELDSLLAASGGRALCLFTSRRAMEAAAVHLGGRSPFTVLVQDELPRPVLARAFAEDETSVLLATRGFWQGFDAPGRSCSLVVLDRLPFGRPDDPLSEARREAATRARRNPFATVDLPAAAILLAQGAGRLLRTAADRGVVAVLDPRLATGSYRWALVKSLPPMRRTKDPQEARRFLAEVTAPAQS